MSRHPELSPCARMGKYLITTTNLQTCEHYLFYPPIPLTVRMQDVLPGVFWFGKTETVQELVKLQICINRFSQSILVLLLIL